MIPAADALQRLREGNHRFVDGESNLDGALAHSQRPDLSGGQQPFATVLACSDSRVPTELIFDQGIGDLFVIRAAGNVVAPTLLGSIEYATKQLGTRLIVVLGHSDCGAVTATLDELANKVTYRSPNLRAIVDRIRPAVDAMPGDKATNVSPDVIATAVRMNVDQSVRQLQHDSLVLETLVAQGDLTIVGAQYSIESGVIEFFDDG